MAVIYGLALVVPALFLAAVVGLGILGRSRLGLLGWMGMVLAVYALVWNVVRAIIGTDAAWDYFALRAWSYYLASWLSLMLTGLTFVGVAIVRGGPSQGTGASVLATGVFGWGYYLTDSGAVFEARLVHIGFGLLFGLGWVALGVGLFAAGTRRSQWPQRPG
jgi:hypothetical protein